MKQVVWVVVALLVIWGVYALATKDSKKEEVPTPPVAETTTPPAGDTAAAVTTPAAEAMIDLADQKPGKEVLVASVVLTAPGFVEIHKVAKDDSAGDLIGSSDLLPIGRSENVKVMLKVALKDGEKVIAMLHTDEGSGKFEADKDQPTMNAAGAVVMKMVAVKK